MRTALACTLAAGVVIAGCGGSSAGVPLAAPDTATLRQDVSAIRTAAAASDPSGAHAAATRLRADAQRLQGEGRLSSADAQSILIAAREADNRISNEVHAPAPAVTSASPPTPAAPAAKPARPAAKPAPPAHAKGPDHGPGHEKGKNGGD
jgi:hypothetical protein